MENLYQVKRLDFGPRFTIVASGFTRRSAAWAWLIDFATQHGFSILDHDIDAENDAIDAMLHKDDAMYQYAVERSKSI